MVAAHIMRAGWTSQRSAAVEARGMVLTVLTGMRWDIDEEWHTPAHRAVLDELRLPDLYAEPDIAGRSTP
jgi:hypothetical protein